MYHTIIVTSDISCSLCDTTASQYKQLVLETHAKLKEITVQVRAHCSRARSSHKAMFITIILVSMSTVIPHRHDVETTRLINA